MRAHMKWLPAERAREISRRAIVLVALALGGCFGGGEPETPASYPPLDFSYLLPLRLNVAAIDVVNRFVPSGEPPDVSLRDPVQPVAALDQMARQRLQALGTTSRAVFSVDDASLTKLGNTISGVMRVELTILDPAGAPVGFAQATVTRSVAGEDRPLPTVLYDFTRAMMDQMNVEFEYQVRHSLGQWLLPAGAGLAPVQATPLEGGPPGAASPPTGPTTPPATPLPPPTLTPTPLPGAPPPPVPMPDTS
ncbi:MAG TPA: hypothetical protein VFA03_09875 [Acetobacteraceae bacterium]|nr:hypothetical protein [Acetobacteraceae bacterium]